MTLEPLQEPLVTLEPLEPLEPLELLEPLVTLRLQPLPGAIVDEPSPQPFPLIGIVPGIRAQKTDIMV